MESGDLTGTVGGGASEAGGSTSLASTSAPAAESTTAGETAAVYAELAKAGASDAAPTDASPTTPSVPTGAARGPDGSGANGTTPVRGPVPYERHEASIRNAREQAKREAEQAARERWGWAESLKRDEATTGANLFRWLQADPVGCLAYLQQQQARSAPAAPEEIQPDFVTEDGREFFTAGSMRKLLQQEREAILGDVKKTFGPMRDRVVLGEMREQANTEARDIRTRCLAEWPLYGELEPQIKEAMLADPNLSLEHAYISAFRDHGMTRVRASDAATQAGQMQRKAAASTVQPSAPRSTTPQRDADRSTRDIASEVFAHASR